MSNEFSRGLRKNVVLAELEQLEILHQIARTRHGVRVCDLLTCV